MTHHNTIHRTMTTWTLLAAACLFNLGCESTQSMGQKKDYHYTTAMEDEFSEAVDRAPTPRTLYTMARLLAARGLEQRAEYVLTRLIDQHPDFAPAYVDLAESYLRRQMTEDATRTLSDGLIVAPNNAVMVNNLGMCYLMTRDYETAARQFEQAHALDPTNDKYATNHATALGLLGQYEQSLKLYQQTLTESDAHYNLAVLAEARQDVERASKEFAQAKILKNLKR